MSKLLELIKESKKAKKEEVVANTLRLPAKLNSTVDGLADQLSLSRHETLVHLVQAGADLALAALHLDEPEVNEDAAQKTAPPQAQQGTKGCSFYLLNTNRRHGIEDHERMLRDGVAAAFYEPWKLEINRIKKGDVVFLYANGTGIVAWGTATGEVQVEDYNGDPDETHYQKLDGFTVLKKPLPASEINKLLDRNFVYLRTMSEMRDGHKVLERLAAEVFGPATGADDR